MFGGSTSLTLHVLVSDGSCENFVNAIRSLRDSARSIERFLFWSVALCAMVYATWWLTIFVLAFIAPRQATGAVPIEGECKQVAWQDDLRLFTWNLGYGGTGAEAAFFMDGGRDVLAKNRDTVLSHMRNIVRVLQEHPSDLYFLQEVDRDSRRTYGVDESHLITANFKEYCSSYAVNHRVPFIPYPYTQPLGRITSGLLSLAAHAPRTSSRIQLPGSFEWPNSAFHLQRCLLVSRLPRQDGKEWVAINLHLEAWDKGEMRKAELTRLREIAMREYEQGNFVVIGGDWNSVLPGIELDQFPTRGKPGAHTMKLPQDFFPPDWRWGVSLTDPTSRRNNTPYRPAETYVTTIDGFLVSPNVHIEGVEVIQLHFADSDHEPVTIALHGTLQKRFVGEQFVTR